MATMSNKEMEMLFNKEILRIEAYRSHDYIEDMVNQALEALKQRKFKKSRECMERVLDNIRQTHTHMAKIN